MRLAPTLASVGALIDVAEPIHPALYVKEVAKTMYVAVRRYDGVPDTQEVARLVREKYVPIISEMPGFVAYYCVDAGDGVMVTTSVFEHKEAEEQSTFRAGQFTAEDLGPLSPNPPQVTAGEVVAYEGGRPETRGFEGQM